MLQPSVAPFTGPHPNLVHVGDLRSQVWAMAAVRSMSDLVFAQYHVHHSFEDNQTSEKDFKCLLGNLKAHQRSLIQQVEGGQQTHEEGSFLC